MLATTTTKLIDKEHGNVEDETYRSFLTYFETDVLGTADTSPLFTTDAAGLWDAYLASFPEGERQFHNCNACRHFVERYGGLVRISENGETTSAMWESEAKSPECSGDRRTNAVWLAVATAPSGFCHPRSSMIGTLLEDIVAGLPFDDVSRKFRSKMQPDVYQRPQAAPSAGAIAQAEKLVEQLGIAPAFERRFARIDELHALWKPSVSEAPTKGGVFGHLKPKGAQPESQLVASAQAITWEKFARTVLPHAKRIAFHVPSRGNFCALLTAVHPDAPPIHQWDSLEKRNPVSHYVYHGGSTPSQWGLATGLREVTAITLSPWQWFDAKCEHQGKAAVFVLSGARDSRTGQGNALFPETLRSELHGVRSVIEAYSRRAEIGGREEASACGYHFSSKGEAVTVRVRSANGVQVDYRIDRWD
jgi:hypothetical protein